MINALEKVVYPNGKTQSLAEIGGAVEGLSALIDEVHTNTSAIGSITSQLSALVSDVNTNTSAIGSITSQLSALVSDVNTNTSAITAINTQLGQLVGDWTLIGSQQGTVSENSYASIQYRHNSSLFDELNGKEGLMIVEVVPSDASAADMLATFEFDGTILKKLQGNRSTAVVIGSSFLTVSNGIYYMLSGEISNKYNQHNAFAFVKNDTSYSLQVTVSLYKKNKPTPPTRTAKKRATLKKKGDLK